MQTGDNEAVACGIAALGERDERLEDETLRSSFLRGLPSW